MEREGGEEKTDAGMTEAWLGTSLRYPALSSRLHVTTELGQHI